MGIDSSLVSRTVIEEEDREQYNQITKKTMFELSAHQRYHLQTDGDVDASIYIEIIALPSEDPGKIAFTTRNVCFEGTFELSADAKHLEVTSGDDIHQIKAIQSGSESYLVHDIFDRKFVYVLADFDIQEPGQKSESDIASVYETNESESGLKRTHTDFSSVYEPESETQCPLVQTVKVARSRRRRRRRPKDSPEMRDQKAAGPNLQKCGTLDKRRKEEGLLARNTFQTGYDFSQIELQWC